MTTNSAVVFASWCPTISELEIATKCIRAVVKNFPTQDIYVGVNSPFYQPWINELKSHKNIIISYVPDENTVDSDASAIISALNSMRILNKTYDYVFFGHTKGASSKSIQDADLFINGFWDQKDSFIEMLSKIADGIGAIFPYAALMQDSVSTIKNIGEFKYTPIPIMATGGFFVCRGNSVRWLLDHAAPEFFAHNLERSGLDRWMLERDLASIVSAFGQVPLPLRIHNHQNVVIEEESYNIVLKKWSEENGNLWIPRLRFIATSEPAFTYCPNLWRIEAMNINNEDIPPTPDIREAQQHISPMAVEDKRMPENFYEYLKTKKATARQQSSLNSEINYVARHAQEPELVADPPTSPFIMPSSFITPDNINQEKPLPSSSLVYSDEPHKKSPLLSIYNISPEIYITDKETTHRYISELYGDIFNNLKPNFKFLEIGTYKAGFVKLVADTYPQSSSVSCDINPLLDYSQWRGNNYQIIKSDAYTENSVKEIQTHFGTFDIIVDDGPHTEASQMFALEHYYELLNPGGVLIVEDVASMPSALLMKMKFHDAEILDLREKNPELYITDNILIIRRKEGGE